MRYAPLFQAALIALLASTSLTGCEGCSESDEPHVSAAERTKVLASALAAPTPPPSTTAPKSDSLGHAVNVIPGQGPRRIESDAPRMGPAFPILPGQGIGPIRFGATQQTIERLMGAACDEKSEKLCRYVARAVDFELENGALTRIRISRKGREAKRNPDGAIVEYGFFNGAILPDLYFGMHPQALQEVLGPPLRVEKISPPGADGLSERHIYDGMTLEYDAWSSGQLVLGAVILTKSETAAAKSEKAERERVKAAKNKPKVTTPPTRVPR